MADCPLTRYRTMSIRIKNGHRLYSYLNELTMKSTNLYNAANFYVRQVFSGLPKEASQRHPYEQAVIDTVSNCLAGHPSLRVPASEHPYLSYRMLDHVFKRIRHEAYYDLPSQANQQVLIEVD